jgi:hypothetical protein
MDKVILHATVVPMDPLRNNSLLLLTTVKEFSRAFHQRELGL